MLTAGVSHYRRARGSKWRWRALLLGFLEFSYPLSGIKTKVGDLKINRKRAGGEAEKGLHSEEQGEGSIS